MRVRECSLCVSVFVGECRECVSVFVRVRECS